MRMLIMVVGLCVASVVSAGPLAEVAGRYTYGIYAVTLPNGRVLSLKDLGASAAVLEISDAAGTITLRMSMLSGKEVVETAKVVEAHVVKGKGYWIAQWPDMSYPAKAVISVSGANLTSDTRFDHPEDTQRFGTVEHAKLTRIEK